MRGAIGGGLGARRATLALALLAAAASIAVAVAAPTGAAARTKWLCKPGERPNPCMGSLKTTVFAGDGSSTVEEPRNARRPKLDCFYVYPTVSEQPTENANRRIDPQQTAIAEYQAARFSETCRVYAPIYRQLTLAAIFGGELGPEAVEIAYGDVLAAWRTYLRRYNDGRGVVLIGHSQGTGMLSRLLRSVIERKRAQRRRLVSALLLGGNVVVPRGERVGGSFRRTPLCGSAGQIRCVVAFSTFGQTPPGDAAFGRTDGALVTLPRGADPSDYRVACTNPAGLAGGGRRLRTIARSEPFPGTLGAGISIIYGGPAPTADTPWLVPADRYRGACVRTNGADVLMISPVAGAPVLNPSPTPAWGLHLLDVNVALGDLIALVRKQGRRYLDRR